MGIQPKRGGKLLLKLNTGTRPIANKYREGKMKSTLKRKLRVRETVSREAHGTSNAGKKFRCLAGPPHAVADPKDCTVCARFGRRRTFLVRCVNECSKRSTRLGGRWQALRGVCVIALGDRVASDRGVAVRAARLALRSRVRRDHLRLLAV